LFLRIIGNDRFIVRQNEPLRLEHVSGQVREVLRGNGWETGNVAATIHSARTLVPGSGFFFRGLIAISFVLRRRVQVGSVTRTRTKMRNMNVPSSLKTGSVTGTHPREKNGNSQQ